MATAAKAVISTGGAQSKTKRNSIPTGGVSITVPARVQSIVFKNAGGNDIRIRINASGANYWTLSPSEVSPKIAVNGASVDAASVGADSILECILEG